MEQSKKILIVEDETALLDPLIKLFNKKGFLAIGARDGVEGLETILKFRPDIVLLDIIMPRMDGLSMLKEMRKNELGKDIPVMILTNVVDSTKKEEALRYGVSDFWIKTLWNFEKLTDRIREKIQETKGQSADENNINLSKKS